MEGFEDEQPGIRGTKISVSGVGGAAGQSEIEDCG